MVPSRCLQASSFGFAFFARAVRRRRGQGPDAQALRSTLDQVSALWQNYSEAKENGCRKIFPYAMCSVIIPQIKQLSSRATAAIAMFRFFFSFSVKW